MVHKDGYRPMVRDLREEQFFTGRGLQTHCHQGAYCVDSLGPHVHQPTCHHLRCGACDWLSFYTQGLYWSLDTTSRPEPEPEPQLEPEPETAPESQTEQLLAQKQGAGAVAQQLRNGGAWTDMSRGLPAARCCESELCAALFRLTLGFLHNHRLTEDCPVELEAGRISESIAACFVVVEPDVIYMDEQYRAQGPVTEAQFFTAWHAQKVQGWPDRSLVWWTNLDGGWVRLHDDNASRQRFGDCIPAFDKAARQQRDGGLRKRMELGLVPTREPDQEPEPQRCTIA